MRPPSYRFGTRHRRIYLRHSLWPTKLEQLHEAVVLLSRALSSNQGFSSQDYDHPLKPRIYIGRIWRPKRRSDSSRKRWKIISSPNMKFYDY
jgi:hypothetical protein